MTAPASIPALIAEGRRLIAAATPGPWTEGDKAIYTFAVDHLAALLDVAEAAVRGVEEDAALGRGVDPALDSALSRLRGLRT